MMPSEVARLARAFEHSAAGMALQTPEGVWLEVNPAFCALVGYVRDELVGKPFTEITHPDDIEGSVRRLERLNDGELSSFRFDKRYLHADGREVWVRLDVSMVLDDAGNPDLIITQAHDITASRQIRDQLAANEARLRSIIRSMAEGVIVIDPAGRFQLGNRRAAEILGLDRETLQKSALVEFRDDCIRADGSRFPLEEFPAAVTLATGQPQHEVQMGVRRADGRLEWIEISTEPVRDENTGDLVAVVATFSDITHRIHIEQALKDKEERLTLALEGAKMGMWDWHLDTREFTFNRIAARMLGYRESEIAPSIESVRSLTHPKDEAALVEAMESHLAGNKGDFQADIRMKRKSGGYVWTYMRGRVTERDASDRPARVTGIVIDISQRKELERRLEQQAITDELTGLYNRRHGNELLQREIDRSRRSRRPLCLVLLDIDHFKDINDRFGHDTGDRVLREVAELLRSRMRRTDAAARWGGEEFALLLPETDAAGGRTIALELLAQMKEIRKPDGNGVSASFGVVDYRGDESKSELVKRADRLMYRAKNAGRARVETE
ncbi:MAG: PAS domain S-box protein [Wenzhouxiangellaceae bacterium]|nr:PAS domain S-box protein [Wenzhouxiangellaceae bacterium]